LEKDELHLGIGPAGNGGRFAVRHAHSLHDAACLVLGKLQARDLLDPVSGLFGGGHRAIGQRAGDVLQERLDAAGGPVLAVFYQLGNSPFAESLRACFENSGCWKHCIIA
jgi:hypothetical protein